jgi:hypothetical protein
MFALHSLATRPVVAAFPRGPSDARALATRRGRRWPCRVAERDKDVSGQDSGFLEGRDVDAHAVVDVWGIQRFLGDELGAGGRCRSAAVQAGDTIEERLTYAEYQAPCGCSKYFRAWPLDVPPHRVAGRCCPGPGRMVQGVDWGFNAIHFQESRAERAGMAFVISSWTRPNKRPAQPRRRCCVRQRARAIRWKPFVECPDGCAKPWS